MRLISTTLLLVLATALTAVAMSQRRGSSNSAGAVPQCAINTLRPIGMEPIDGERFATYHGNKIGLSSVRCDTRFLAQSKERKTRLSTKVTSLTRSRWRSSKYTLTMSPVLRESYGSMEKGSLSDLSCYSAEVLGRSESQCES